jgi:hypothetical protein
VAIVPNASALASKLKRIERLKAASFAAQFQGFSSSGEYAAALMAQLGVDLRSPISLMQAGIDPNRGLAVALLPGNRAYLVLGLADLDRLRHTLASMAKNRMGAAVASTREERGQSLTSFSGAAGSQLGFIAKAGWALIALGESISELPGYASLAPVDSLAEAPGLTGALRRLPPGQDIYLYFPLVSSITGQYGLGECTVAAQLTEDALRVRAELPRISSRLAFAERGQAPDLVSFLPKDAFLMARYDGNPRLLEGILRAALGSQFIRAAEQVRFDLSTEVLGNLRPGMVASLSLAPTVMLSGLPELNVRQTNPFQYVHLVALGEVRDRAKAQATLERIPQLASLVGAKVERADHSGNTVYLTTYAQGEGTHLAQFGDRIAIASPMRRLDEVIARLRQSSDREGASSDDSGLRKGLEADPVVAVLDFRRLTESVKSLPASAFGVGGFAIKATMLRWLDSVGDLRTMSVGFAARDGILQAELDLRFAQQ